MSFTEIFLAVFLMQVSTWIIEHFNLKDRFHKRMRIVDKVLKHERQDRTGKDKERLS